MNATIDIYSGLTVAHTANRSLLSGVNDGEIRHPTL